MINVSEALDCDTAEIITVYRFNPGQYVDGIYQDGFEKSFKALASVQQQSPQLMQMLVANERDSDSFVFICNKFLYTVNDRDCERCDEILYRGYRYRVTSVADWTAYGHCIASGARIK